VSFIKSVPGQERQDGPEHRVGRDGHHRLRVDAPQQGGDFTKPFREKFTDKTYICNMANFKFVIVFLHIHMALKYLEIRDLCPQYSDKSIVIVSGWKIVDSLRI
jgi:hypothetical protein